jgi:transposase
VKLMPADYVRPFVKSNRNDSMDAEAITEAVQRPTMRFVPVKNEAQLVFRPCTASQTAGSAGKPL